MGNSKELFALIREAELRQSEEYRNYQVLAYLRGFKPRSNINIPIKKEKGSDNPKIKNMKTELN